MRNSNFRWIYSFIFSHMKYAVFLSRAISWCTIQGKLQKWETVHHAVFLEITLFYFLRGTNDFLLRGQGIIKSLCSSVKRHVIKAFWPLYVIKTLYVIRHSRDGTAFSNCTVVLQHLECKKEINFGATWKCFIMLTSILKVWEMNQNKGITIPFHSDHRIVIELFPPNTGIDFPPLFLHV